MMQPFDPLAPAVLPDPYPHYARLRADDPIHWGSAADAGAAGRWYITRYDDVVALLKDQRFGREVEKVAPDAAQPVSDDANLKRIAAGWMILRDPPVHTRLRSLVSSVYVPRQVNALQPVVEGLANRLIDEMLAAGPPLDLLAHFSLPLTVHMTAHMLGLPAADYDLLMPWSRALAAVIDLNQDEAIRRKSRAAIGEFTDYLHAIIAERRREPRDDLISALVLRTSDETGRPDKLVSDEELVAGITHLLFVGNDPVMHEIALAVITLLRHRQQLALLRAQPDLIANAVDELLRYDSSVQMTFRYALTGVTLHGKSIRAGDHIAVVLAAANRDPACCPAPDRLDITRPVGQVATFGAGIHYCLGAPLARLKGQIGLNALLQRLPDLALASDALEWQPTVAVRGPVALPVSF